MMRVRFGAFSNSVIDAVARRQGMYADEGLDVEFCRVTSSPGQFEGLSLGQLHIAATAADNVLNYRYNRGVAGGPPLDVRIVRAVERAGGLRLAARRGVESVAALRGAAIAVDDPDSGFALPMYELLARAGLAREKDYRVVPFGGTPRRFQGLLDGEFDATMLNAGFDLRAADSGCGVLLTVSDFLPGYIAFVLAALPGWLDSDPAAAAFLRAWDRAAGYALDPVNREACLDVFREDMSASADLAGRMYAQATDPRFGLVPGGAIPGAGVSLVADVRSRHGQFPGDVDITAALLEPDGLIHHRLATVS
jgi:ABC-type nitrate/sulfonate/bicarbonate transport system substrate-binding protein